MACCDLCGPFMRAPCFHMISLLFNSTSSPQQAVYNGEKNNHNLCARYRLSKGLECTVDSTFPCEKSTLALSRGQPVLVAVLIEMYVRFM